MGPDIRAFGALDPSLRKEIVSEPTTLPDAEINIEEIMQQIRQQIAARRAETLPEGMSDLVLSGKRFPPEFYEHLYYAQMALDDYHVPVHVSKSSVPIIGSLIEKLRGKLHELVLYYVNQSAARQVSASNHLLKALSIMAKELDETDDATR